MNRCDRVEIYQTMDEAVQCSLRCLFGTAVKVFLYFIVISKSYLMKAQPRGQSSLLHCRNHECQGTAYEGVAAGPHTYIPVAVSPQLTSFYPLFCNYI